MNELPAQRSRYESIARDLAVAVSSGRLSEGARFSCRQLAHNHGVSAETVRRAAVLLAEQGVVRMEVGSGVIVLSRTSASAYLDHLRSDLPPERLRAELEWLYRERGRLDEAIVRLTLHLLDYNIRQNRRNAADEEETQ